MQVGQAMVPPLPHPGVEQSAAVSGTADMVVMRPPQVDTTHYRSRQGYEITLFLTHTTSTLWG